MQLLNQLQPELGIGARVLHRVLDCGRVFGDLPQGKQHRSGLAPSTGSASTQILGGIHSSSWKGGTAGATPG